MKCDYHIHTDYSDDSVYLMEDVVKDAIKMGLDEICFTDHVDYGIKYDWDEKIPMIYRDNGDPYANVDYPKYFDELEYLINEYSNDITIKKGLEFGIQMHTIDQYERLYHKYPFDFIILSVHQVDDLEFWNNDYQKGKTQEECNMGYYNELLNVVKNYKDYSVLGHLDLICRYDPYGFYPFEKIKNIVTEILKVVIKDGKGIEFNTSFHRYGLPDTTPSRDILKLYKDLGGTIITIGSDSHQPSHLGAYVDEAQDILRSLGFEYFCTYENMKPIYHKL